MKSRRDASPEGTWDDKETFSLQELRKKSRDAVLQAQLLSSDEECCSYDKGYTEQLVFACLTCVSEDDKMAGMCIACSLNCHENHETVEIFEKRAFRCDCGNEKFNGNYFAISSYMEGQECTLQPAKENLNVLNKYNHNFRGRYCHCDQEYDESGDTMIQCLLCQDWFHDNCVETNLEASFEDNVDFLCKNCTLKSPILRLFQVRPSGEPLSGPICFSKASNEIEGVPLQDTFLHNSIASLICRCANCMALLEQQGLEFLIEGPSDEESELKRDEDIDLLTTKALSELPAAVGLEVASQFKDFLSTVSSELLRQLGPSDHPGIVTKDDVDAVLQRASSILGKRRRYE